jgi:acetylornithine deacetylase/succinyl-diaminopimelate desuccinylase-like protein
MRTTDGQPVEPERWASPPWAPVLRDGPLKPGARTIDLASLRGPLDPEWRVFARSASDDKAPILAIPAALDALKALGVKPSVNLKLFFEGEEEAARRTSPRCSRRTASCCAPTPGCSATARCTRAAARRSCSARAA